MKTTQQRIAEIQASQYNNFKGSLLAQNKVIHDDIRNNLGDEKYLWFLEESVRANPKPVYNIPEEYFILKNHDH